VFDQRGDYRSALDFYRQSIEAREKIRTAARLEEFKTKLAEQATDIYERVVLLHQHLGDKEQAFHYSERARARTFLDQLGNVRPGLHSGVQVQLVEREQAARAAINGLGRALGRERAKAAANENHIRALEAQYAAKLKEYELLLTQIKLGNSAYASLRSVETLSLAEVRRRLDKYTTLVSYFVTPGKTLAFVITHDSFELVPLEVKSGDLKKYISWFRRFDDLTDASPESLQQLHAWLVKPLEKYINTRKLGVIPHDVLHYLPFGALTDGHAYLGDRVELFTLPSASVLPFINEGERRGERLLAVAQKEADGLPLLEHVDGEAQSIARLYDSAPLLTPAATKAKFRAEAGAYDILHIAAHGELDPISPLFSRIFLAPDGGDDGRLSVGEVYELNLSKANLVVLSACETQLGAKSQGDDIVGLSRAFIYAGAPSIVASLWTVEDEATSQLMVSFYTHLKRGLSKAAALQAAQKEARARHPHPYYWAAFVLTGEPE
jgi:CHAT domain-containing protein